MRDFSPDRGCLPFKGTVTILHKTRFFYYTCCGVANLSHWFACNVGLDNLLGLIPVEEIVGKWRVLQDTESFVYHKSWHENMPPEYSLLHYYSHIKIWTLIPLPSQFEPRENMRRFLFSYITTYSRISPVVTV